MKKKLKREKRLIKYLKFYKLMCDVSEPCRLHASLFPVFSEEFCENVTGIFARAGRYSSYFVEM